MPLGRHAIHNEYGLAAPELYRNCGEENPEALLEGLAMAGMVGLLRQLGDLAEFAADIFHDLQEEVMGTAGRTHELLLRVQEMEAELPAAEKFLFTEAHHLNFAYAPGKELHMIDYSHENLYSQGDLPRFVRNLYKECRGPPRLFPLDRFDISGDGACLKRYTNPSFVKVEWANSAISRTEREQITKKARRNRNRHRHRMNLDMKARKSLSLIQARVQQSSSDRQDMVGVFNALKSNPVLEEQSEKPNVCFNQGKIGIQSTIRDSDSLGVGRAFRNGIYQMDKQIIPSEPLRISAKELETASTRFFKKEMTGAFPQSNGDSGLNSKGRGILSMASKSVTLSELLKLSDKNDFGHGNDSVPYYWHPPLTCNGNTSLNEKREMQTKGGLSKSTENGSKNMNSEVPDNNRNDTICDEDHFVDAPKLDEKREMETKGGLSKSMENESKNMNSEVPDSNCNDAICDEDHFVDALNTMESEGETSESKEKEEADNFSIRMNSEAHTNGLILSETVNGSEKAVSDPKNSNGVADEREAGQVSSTLFPEIDNSSVKLNSEVETDGYILSELGNGLVRVKKSKSVSDLSDLDKNSNGSANEREAEHLSFVLSEVDNSLVKMNSELDTNGLTISETFNGEVRFENLVTDTKNNNGSVNEREVEPLSSVLFGVDNSDHFSLKINLEDHTDDPIFLKTDNGSVQMMEADLDLPVLDKNSDASDLDTDVDGRFKEGKMDSPTTIMDWHMDEGFNQVSDEKKRSLKEFEDPQGKPLEFHSKAREEDENDEDDDEDSLGVMQVSSGSTSPSSSPVLGPIKSSSFDDVPCVSENDLRLSYFESLLHSSASSGRNSSVSQSTVVILDSNSDLPLERESSEAFTSCFFSQLESQFGYEIPERNSHECGDQSPRLSTSLSHDLLLQATQEWSANNTLSCEKTIEIHDRDADLSALNCDRISAVVLPLDFKQDAEMPLVTSEPCLLVLETTNLQSVNNIGIDQGVQACSSPLKGEGLCIDPARNFPDLIFSVALDSTQEISVIPLQTTSVPSYDAIAPHSAQILEHPLPSLEVIQMDCTHPIALSSDLTTLAFIESRAHPEFRSSSSQCSEEISEREPSPSLSPFIHQIRESPITCTPLSKQSMEHLPPCLQHSEETAMDHIQPSNLSSNHEPILAFIERMDPAPPLSPSLSLQTRESPISCTSLLEQSMERLLPSLKHSEETVMDYNIHPTDLSSDSERTLTFIESRDSYPPSSPPFSPQIRESPTTCTPPSKQNIEPILLSLLHPEETVMDHNIHPTDHSSNPESTLDFIESKDPYPPLSFPFSPQSREAPITCTPLLKQTMDPILPSLQHSEETEMDNAHPIALSCTSESASAFIESRDPSPHLSPSCSLQTRESSIASSMLSKQSMDQPLLPSLQNSEETLMDHNIHLIDLSSNSEPAPDFIESRHPSPPLSPSFSPEIRESPIACTPLPNQSMDPLPPSLPHSEETVMDHTYPIALSCNSLTIPFIESREINPEFHVSSLQSLEEISTGDPSSSLTPSYSVQNRESSNAYTPPLQQIMEPPLTSSEEMLMGCGLPLVPSCNLTTSSSQCQEEISVYPSSPLSPSYSVQTRESPDAFSPLLTVAIDSILSSSSPFSFHPDLTQTVNLLGLNADLSRDVESPLISPTGPSDNFLVVSTENSELLEELEREEPQIKQSADAFTPLLEVAIDPILFSSPSEFHPNFTQTVNSDGLNANLSPDVEADLINPSGPPDNFPLVSTENSRILEELDKEELFGDLTNLPDVCKPLLQNREEEMADSIEDASVSSTQVLDIPRPILHTEKIESLEEALVDPNELSKTLPEISSQDMEPLREEISEDHTAPSTAINNSIFVSTDTTETPNTIIADNIQPSAFSNDSLFSPTQTDKLLELNVADNSEVSAPLSRFSSPLQHEQEILEDSTRASDIVKIPLLVVEPIIDSPTLDQHSSECAEEIMANDSNHSVLSPPFRNVEEIIFDTTDVSALSNPLPLVTTQIREPSNSQSAPLECVEPRAMNCFQSSPHSKNFKELSTGPLQCPESLFINSDDNHSTLDPNMSSSLLVDSQPDSSFSIQPHDIHAHMLQNSEEESSLIKSTHPLNPLVDFDYPLATEHLSLAQPSACRNAESTSNELLDLESTPAESVSSSFKSSTQANHTVDYPELSIKHGRVLPNSLAFAEPEQIERMNSLIEAIASHDRSKLRKVTDVPHVPRPRPLTDREKLLEQIKSCAFKLRPTVVEKHACPHSAPSNNVAAILEKVNAIRQAFAGSDEDSDFSDDDWN